MAFPTTFAALKAAGYRFDNDARCRGCGRDIEWWITPNNRKIPMDPMNPANDESPAVAHHATCPDVKQFRGGKR